MITESPQHFPEDSQSPVPSVNDQQQEIMEVHKHPHHVTHKKNWKEYFLEFFMLFLAVFLGFLAENLREHFVEKDRAHQYIESFYQDLKTDTTRISHNIAFDQDKINGLANLTSCYESLTKGGDEVCMLNIIKSTAINRPFIRTDRTLKQLSNAGGFRLLRSEDADSINAYEAAFDDFQDFQSTVYQEVQNSARTTLNGIGNFEANAQMFKPEAGKRISISTVNPAEITVPLLFSSEKAVLNKYFNELLLYFRVTFNHMRIMLELRDQQTRLIEYFKTKYHFD